MNVSYNKSECIISSKDQVVLMKDSRSKNNYYMCISQPSSKVKSMKEIIFEDGVNGLPKLKSAKGKIHDACQVGKQTKLLYKTFQHLTRVPELPFMGFKRLMQGVVIEGKTDGQVGSPPNNEQPIVVQKK